MKQSFTEFSRPSAKELEKIWGEAIFVFDTNVLISLYRLPQKSRKHLLTILEKLKEQIWIPHQVGLEYYRKRIEIIYEHKYNYEDILQLLDRTKEDVLKKLGELKHPSCDWKDISRKVSDNFKENRDQIEHEKNKHLEWLKKDLIEVSLNKIFKGKVGSAYDKKKLQEIYSIGTARYDKEIPPGYKDKLKDKSDKSATRKFADLIIWFQIIDKAKESKKPIIFITDEQKEDWWWKAKREEVIGPRYELKKEIEDEAKVNFHMYKTDSFIEFAGKHLKIRFNKSLMEEVKKIGEEIQKKQDLVNSEEHISTSVSDSIGINEPSVSGQAGSSSNEQKIDSKGMRLNAGNPD